MNDSPVSASLSPYMASFSYSRTSTGSVCVSSVPPASARRWFILACSTLTLESSSVVSPASVVVMVA